MPHYKRILLKISGEALLGKEPSGIDPIALKSFCERIISLHEKGYEIALVVGAGNIFRGMQQKNGLKIERTPADQMGMLATLINGVAIKDVLDSFNYPTTIMSALDCPQIAESYQWHKAIKKIQEGNLLLFVGGTGHPYFTTDTAAALRACEIKADIFLKCTMHVDGIYDRDPRFHKDAKKFDRLTYRDMVEKRIGVMDLTAVTLCMTNNVPIRVVNFGNSFLDALSLEKNTGTLVSGD